MTVGSQLQEARDTRTLSIADVSKETKIQPWVLEALEEDRLSELMSPIYVKGFLTTYAKFLHLDPMALISKLTWPQPVQQDSVLVPETKAALPPAVRLRLSEFSFARLRRSAVALTVSAVVAILVIRHPAHKAALNIASSKSVASKLASVSQLNTDARTEPSLPTLTLLPSHPLELELRAERTTWIRVRADGKLLTEQRFVRGAMEHWTANKRFELIIAKPSQVELSLNGQSIGPFAIAHRGRLLITHRGIAPLPDNADTDSKHIQ